MKNKNFYKKILLAYLFLIMAVFTVGYIFQPILFFSPLLLSFSTFLVVPFIILHSVSRYKKNSLLLILLIISISSFCELIGIYYGVLFGSPYRYSDLLGFKILDIPLLAVGGWLIIIYSSFTMTNLIFDKQHALLAVVDAIIATSLDLVIDPVMIGVGAWVWLGKGEYFGVPWANYGGWFIIVFSTCFIFRMYMFRKKINTAIDESNFKTKLERIWLVSPIATYLFLFIGYAHLAYMQNMIDIILIGLLSSQTIVFLALFRFYEKYWK